VHRPCLPDGDTFRGIARVGKSELGELCYCA